MNDNEKTILQKLANIFSTQQKVMTRLAQATDPNMAYLKRAAEQAAANVGLEGMGNAFKVEVSLKPADEILNPHTSYIVSIFGAPAKNEIRQKFLDTFNKQVETQKPELAGNVSTIFH